MRARRLRDLIAVVMCLPAVPSAAASLSVLEQTRFVAIDDLFGGDDPREEAADAGPFDAELPRGSAA